MSKGRSLSGKKELDDLQRARREIDKLKKQISSLRKQLKRVDMDRYHDLRDLVEKQYAEDKEAIDAPIHEKKLQETWRCHKCVEGYLRIVLMPRLDGIYYLRKCSNDECGKRTRLQKYDKIKVTGIIEGEKGDDDDTTKKTFKQKGK